MYHFLWIAYQAFTENIHVNLMILHTKIYLIHISFQNHMPVATTIGSVTLTTTTASISTGASVWFPESGIRAFSKTAIVVSLKSGGLLKTLNIQNQLFRKIKLESYEGYNFKLISERYFSCFFIFSFSKLPPDYKRIIISYIWSW